MILDTGQGLFNGPQPLILRVKAAARVSVYGRLCHLENSCRTWKIMKRLIFRLVRTALACALAFATAGAARAGIPPITDGEGVPTLAPILEQITPAVVNIAVLSRAPEEDNPMLQDPFFRRFFGLSERAQPQISAGSGVIVDAKLGHVLTNHHVIKDAKQIVVTLKDGRQIEARLLGSDAATDIALLK